MARIRTVKPELFGSFPLADIPIEARFLFVGLFTEADDEGRLIDSPKRLAGTLFPHDDSVTETTVIQWLDYLEKVECITRYKTARGQYLAIPNWSKHQRISHPKPSRFPPPPEVLRKNSGESPEKFREEQGTGNREQGREKRTRTFGAEFENNFWPAFPRKVGKATAKSAFLVAARHHGPEVIVEGAERLRDDPNLPEKQFIPHPTTWIHREGWNDEPLPPRYGAIQKDWFEE